MYSAITEKRSELISLCVSYRVRHLALFGSAATGDFDSRTSDLDFLVDFYPMPPAEHAEHFFSLQESLEKLFGLPIDLVESAPIRNPYILKSISASQVELYDAA